MSKLNRREFKELLTEWQRKLILESKIDDIKKEFVDSTPQKVSQEEWNFYVNNPDSEIRNKLRKDTLFLDIVYNTLKEGKHSIYDIISLFKDYTIHVLPQFSKGEELYVKVPGGRRIDLRSALEEKTVNYDILLSYLEAKEEIRLNTKAFVSCLNESSFSETSGNTNHFDVIISNSSDEWVICYPRSIKGSIALSRSYWNGKRLVYDNTFNKVKDGRGKYAGAMTWCTSIDSTNNMFLNYHRQLNLHMYYCIRKKIDTENTINKMCLSFAKKGNNISLQEGSVTVDEFNGHIKKDQATELLGYLYEIIEKDVEKDDKEEITPTEYYESITLDQFKTLKKANEENIKIFIPEAQSIIRHSVESTEISEYLAYEENIELRKLGIKSDSLSKEVILDLLNKEKDEKIITYILDNSNCPIEKITELSNDKDTVEYVNRLIKNKHCPIDILTKIIKKEYDYKNASEDAFAIEELELVACFTIVKTNQYDAIDHYAKESFREIVDGFISNDDDMFVEDFYFKLSKEERINSNAYDIFFDLIDYSQLGYIGIENVLKDSVIPKNYLNSFFEEILPPSTSDMFSFAADNLALNYIGIINHKDLPVKLFKNIIDLAEESVDFFSGESGDESKKIYLEVLKCDRVPDDVVKELTRHDDNEVSKAATKVLRSRHPLIIAAKKYDIKEEELLAMSSGRSFRQKYEITKRNDLNSFSKEIVVTVLRNIIESGKKRSRLLVSLSERTDLKTLGLNNLDLKNIYNFIESNSILYDAEDVKIKFAKIYPEVLSSNITTESYLKNYIKLFLN